MGFHRFCINAGKKFFAVEKHAPCIKHFNAKDERLAMLHIIGQYGMIVLGCLSVVVIIGIIMITIYSQYHDACRMCGVTDKVCYPFPDTASVKLLSDYYGYKPSGSWMWDDMCRRYI